MADDKQGLIAENKRLAEEAKKAVLTRIIADAPTAGTSQIERVVCGGDLSQTYQREQRYRPAPFGLVKPGNA
jgi:hypothetical protein